MRRRIALAVALLLFAGAQSAPAATIVIVNVDGAGEGFNDPTPVAPVGGNSGTTRGQQRLNLFLHAAGIWGSILPSNVTIRVQSSFDPMPCTATSAVLGSAGPIDVEMDFAGAEFANTWYHVALANRLAGTDLQPTRDDIRARFNSALDDNATCLGGIGWYYGFDNNHGSAIDLLPVLLHEMGHGLGFSTLVDHSTGAMFFGSPDMYMRNIRDTHSDRLWTQMTDAERRASAVNSFGVVWDGVSVRGHVPSFLGPRPVLVVNAPAAIAGTYSMNTASFGGAVTTGGLTGQVVLADDGAAPNGDACTPLVNGAQIAGKIALIDRGTCTNIGKVKRAQDAGAIAAIIANNTSGEIPPTLSGTDPTVTIPAVSVTQATGDAIKARLANGVNVTIRLDPNQIAGADAQRRPYLYAPDPLQSGSSISHWDQTARPNLLMEPSINSDLTSSVDLTRYLFEDIGWFGPTTDAVAGAAPRRTRLLGNVPNPFNPTTTVQFELGRDGDVSLDVFDVAGRRVKNLARGALRAGLHPATWDGTDAAGRRVPSGVYLVRLKTRDVTESRRMVLLE